MSLYEPLKKYLASSNQNFVKLSFSDIEVNKIQEEKQ